MPPVQNTKNRLGMPRRIHGDPISSVRNEIDIPTAQKLWIGVLTFTGTRPTPASSTPITMNTTETTRGAEARSSTPCRTSVVRSRST